MTSLARFVAGRVRGDFDIDEWGHDPELVGAVAPLLRFRTEVTAAHVPDSGPAVIVANRRSGVCEPFVLMRAVRQRTGRLLRFLGIPDVAPLALPLRRLGGAVDDPHELRGLLRAGHLVALPLGPTFRKPLRAGNLDPRSLAPALELGVAVIPAAVVGGELTGRWRVHIGSPVPHPSGPPTPLALAELADSARAGVQELLDEAFPPRWFLG